MNDLGFRDIYKGGLWDDLHVYGLNGGQRYINITRNEIGPKSGQKDCR